jgi:signal transduction histidine kinase
LYLCRQIVEAHGGKIACSSEEGRGSKFLFTIPLEGGSG